jgi:integrase
VVRYLAEWHEKRSIRHDRDQLCRLDPYLRDPRLDRINMDAIWPFIRDRRDRDGVSNSTINRALEIVRRILNLAHQEWNWLQRVPRIRMLPEPKRRIRFLTREEADRLIEALPEHLRPVVWYALATGCRMSEILHLEWERVDFGRRVEQRCCARLTSGGKGSFEVVLHVRRKADAGRGLGVGALVTSGGD